jgi:hypothetical protein
MSVPNRIFLVMDAGTPMAAFTARRELQAYLRPCGHGVMQSQSHSIGTKSLSADIDQTPNGLASSMFWQGSNGGKRPVAQYSALSS